MDQAVLDLVKELNSSLDLLQPILDGDVQSMEVAKDALAKCNADIDHLATLHAEQEQGVEELERAVDALLRGDNLVALVEANIFDEERHKQLIQKWCAEITAINDLKDKYENEYFDLQERKADLRCQIVEKRVQIAEAEEKKRKEEEDEKRKEEEEKKRKEEEGKKRKENEEKKRKEKEAKKLKEKEKRKEEEERKRKEEERRGIELEDVEDDDNTYWED